MQLDEVLYMEIRVFQDFLNRVNLRASDAYDLFDKYDIWGYIEKGYDVFHMGGDDLVVNDIQMILERNGAIA